MDIKEVIHDFISIHESQISYDMNKKDENIEVTFTTFGNRAGCRALFNVIEMLDDDMKSKVIEMMQNSKYVV